MKNVVLLKKTSTEVTYPQNTQTTAPWNYIFLIDIPTCSQLVNMFKQYI